MTGCLDGVIRPLVLILPKMSRYDTTFKDGDKDKNKNNKLMSFHIHDDKLLKKYETTRSKIEDFKNIELSAFPSYDDKYIKTKIRTYSDKVCTNFHVFNVSEDGVDHESFTVISIDSCLFL